MIFRYKQARAVAGLTIALKLLTVLLLARCRQRSMVKISVKGYQKKVYAFWLGQIIGDLCGLPHKNDYIDEPGPDNFPYEYPEYQLNYMKEIDGVIKSRRSELTHFTLSQS